MSNLDDICKKYFFMFECNFIFIATSNGIIITKDLSFNIQLKQDIISFYLAIREVLPKQAEQSLLEIVNKLPKAVKNLYILMLLHNQNFSHLIQAVNCIEAINEELYLCAPEMDSSSVNAFWQHQCNSKLILSKQCLQATHIDDARKLFKTIDSITGDLNIISFENCDLCHTMMKTLAVVISNVGNDKIWDSFTLQKCNITDDHVQCFYEQYTQCRRQCQVHIKSVNLSNNNISSSRIKEISHLLEQWKSEELIITGNNLQHDGLQSLIHAITNESNSLCLHILDARINNIQCSREQITELCELIVFNKNSNITSAKIQDFLILDGNRLDSNIKWYNNIADATSICFTGKISASKQETFLTNAQRLLLPFKNFSLDNLHFLVSGEMNFDIAFFNVLK